MPYMVMRLLFIFITTHDRLQAASAAEGVNDDDEIWTTCSMGVQRGGHHGTIEAFNADLKEWFTGRRR